MRIRKKSGQDPYLRKNRIKLELLNIITKIGLDPFFMSYGLNSYIFVVNVPDILFHFL